jgi:hypothetical protein
MSECLYFHCHVGGKSQASPDRRPPDNAHIPTYLQKYCPRTAANCGRRRHPYFLPRMHEVPDRGFASRPRNIPTSHLIFLGHAVQGDTAVRLFTREGKAAAAFAGLRAV